MREIREGEHDFVTAYSLLWTFNASNIDINVRMHNVY